MILSIKNYVWVSVPILAIVAIFSSAFLVWGPGSKLERIFGKQKIAQEEAAKLAIIKTKLKTLESADKDKVDEGYKKMLAAMPETRLAWILSEELKSAATDSGMEITSYTGVVGDVTQSASEEAKIAPKVKALDTGELTLNWVFEGNDDKSAQQLLSLMENYYPLVKVVSADYDQGKLTLKVQGAWKAREKGSADVYKPLPDYQAKLARVSSKLDTMVNYIPLQNTSEEYNTTAEKLF